MSGLDAIVEAHLVLRDVVLLYPLATVLHVLEEWPRFPRWARRFTSPRYSDREYLVTHAATVALASASALVVRAAPTPWVVLPFVAFVFGPGAFWNAWFHAGASLWSRTYCAGVATGLLLYVPLAIALAGVALREGIVGPEALATAVVVAGVVHALEVGRNVFKRW